MTLHIQQRPTLGQEGGRLEVLIPVRWTPSDAATLDILAGHNRVTVSELIRDLAARGQRCACSTNEQRVNAVH